MLDKYNNFQIKKPYHDGRKLLSMLDLNKEKPEIYIDTTNRSAGKTTFYNAYLVSEFLKTGDKFCLIYRCKYETESVSESFFKDIKGLFFQGLNMVQIAESSGTFQSLYIAENGVSNVKEMLHCGYAISLSSVEQIKKNSHLLSDVKRMLFDEFQPESGRYLKNEVSKLMSVHDSIARGQGSQTRYVPLIMVGNLIDMYNPYYEAMGISRRLDLKTNYMRGDGWVLAQGFNESAAIQREKSGFHRAFAGTEYTALSEKKQYLYSDISNIRNDIQNCGFYFGTIHYKSKDYGIRYIEELNCLYISEKAEPSWKLKFAARESDIDEYSQFFVRHRIKDKVKTYLHKGALYYSSHNAKNAGLAFVYGRD